MEKKIENKFFVFKSAVNVLTNTPKISNFAKGEILEIISPQSDEKI